MKELSGRANAVLEHYRAVESLRETEKGRLLETLQARAARGDAPMAGVEMPFPSPVPNMSLFERFWTAPLGKAGIGIVSMAAAATLVAVAAMRPIAPVRRTPEPAMWADDPGTLNHARPEPLPAPALGPVNDEPAAPPDIAPAPKARVRAATSAARPGGSSASSHEATGPTTVDEEVRLLHDAQLALRSNEPRRAMALLDQHAAKFPSGQFADAREVTRMLALCNLGARAAAREKADHFLAERPGSPFADRVRRICADSDP